MKKKLYQGSIPDRYIYGDEEDGIQGLLFFGYLTVVPLFIILLVYGIKNGLL